MKIRAGMLGLTAVLAVAFSAIASAQDLQKGVTYVCNGERIFIENCNIRDTSDTSTCMVGHPDTVLSNGLMKYTTETRGALKKLFPTCKQPSANEVAHAKAFEKKQNDTYEANVKKANEENDAIEARAQAVITGKPAQTPEEKAIARCISAGRLPATCTGNQLLGAFGKMVSQVLPGADKQPQPGLNMAGVFQGAGNWRLDFIDGGVLVNCAFLSPNQEAYTIQSRNNRPAIVVDTKPKPLVLTLTPEGNLVAPGPVTINGVVATGQSGGGGDTYQGNYRDSNGSLVTDRQAASGMSVYDQAGNRVFPTNANAGGYTTFSPRTASCPALNLTSKGAGTGIQTMQTDLLKTMFGGDKGPPTPPGLRMHGNYAAQTGFNVEFYPESVIVACGEPARAYAYEVVANGAQLAIKIADPGHPLLLNMKSDGSLDPGSGPYLVHGRRIIGQDNNDDFKFAPLESTCNLGVLVPGATAPATAPAQMTASMAAGTSNGAAPKAGGPPIASPGAPTGNAVLTIVSGFAAPAGTANPLAGHPYVLLRDDLSGVLTKGGVAVPAGTPAVKVLGQACGMRSPDCQKILGAISADTAAAIRADATGKATFAGVAAGTYYLMISTRMNNQSLYWGQKVELKAGANSITLDQKNATPLN